MQDVDGQQRLTSLYAVMKGYNDDELARHAADGTAHVSPDPPNQLPEQLRLTRST